MTRTPPSAADLQLIHACCDQGIPLKPSRLATWRKYGLIPSPAPVYLGGRRGSQRRYPPGTEHQVAGLAVCDLLHPRMSPFDLVLLAFFAEMPLPFLPTVPLKAALALAYFDSRPQRQDEEQRAFDAIPVGWRDELPADFNWAETQAELEFKQEPAHVRQMRANLKRLPGLARATREQLDARVHGVLTTLNRACLPVEDTDAMADLKAAMAFDGPPARSRAAWMYASICHAEQLAVRRETSGVERFDALMALENSELLHFRELALEALNAMYTSASEGRLQRFEIRSPDHARMAGGLLVEWNSVRHVVDAGARPAQLTRDALHSLWSACSHAGGGGEGRAAFAARTAGRRSAPRGNC
ncbi:hypothetical protein [Streptomyces bambusae]|uniref:Uncharacterized protein n=1 Tax=Streptomyces bambusae TaxID=1550616 RepID=A0ABS6Z4C9_9ACTN|nr:hypothetical protein [Streptomyces bambusae]MBW5482623.1 hypothetical protein [Streptomyces bambusae]